MGLTSFAVEPRRRQCGCWVEGDAAPPYRASEPSETASPSLAVLVDEVEEPVHFWSIALSEIQASPARADLPSRATLKSLTNQP
jgi:hypothetical protein